MKSKNGLLVICVLALFSTLTVSSQILGRRSSWEAKIKGPEGGLPGSKIVEVKTNSPLGKAGFLANDIIIEVDGIPISDGEVWSEVSYGLRANKPTKIKAVRNAEVVQATVKFNPLEKETHPGLDTYYEEITSPYGITQRIIITKPKKPGKQPAIVLIGGLSCSSIETYPGRQGNWVQTMKDLVENRGWWLCALKNQVWVTVRGIVVSPILKLISRVSAPPLKN